MAARTPWLTSAQKGRILGADSMLKAKGVKFIRKDLAVQFNVKLKQVEKAMLPDTKTRAARYNLRVEDRIRGAAEMLATKGVKFTEDELAVHFNVTPKQVADALKLPTAPTARISSASLQPNKVSKEAQSSTTEHPRSDKDSSHKAPSQTNVPATAKIQKSSIPPSVVDTQSTVRGGDPTGDAVSGTSKVSKLQSKRHWHLAGKFLFQALDEHPSNHQIEGPSSSISPQTQSLSSGNTIAKGEEEQDQRHGGRNTGNEEAVDNTRALSKRQGKVSQSAQSDFMEVDNGSELQCRSGSSRPDVMEIDSAREPECRSQSSQPGLMEIDSELKPEGRSQSKPRTSHLNLEDDRDDAPDQTDSEPPLKRRRIQADCIYPQPRGSGPTSINHERSKEQPKGRADRRTPLSEIEGNIIKSKGKEATREQDFPTANMNRSKLLHPPPAPAQSSLQKLDQSRSFQALIQNLSSHAATASKARNGNPESQEPVAAQSNCTLRGSASGPPAVNAAAHAGPSDKPGRRVAAQGTLKAPPPPSWWDMGKVWMK